MAIRSRFLASAVLVVIAFGGAGLAVAADSSHGELGQPDTSRAADRAAQPLLAAVARDLGAVTDPVNALAAAGRDMLGNLQGLNFDAMNAAIAAGDTAVAQLNDAVNDVNADDTLANVGIDRTHIGQSTSIQFDTTETAVSAVSRFEPAWAAMKARAALVVALVSALQRHDDLVFQATDAARQNDWPGALTAIDDAGAALVDVERARAALVAAGATTQSVDGLVKRYSDYDGALRGLYSYVESNGQTGDQFALLSKAVADAQRALPADTSVYSLIVGESAGSLLADELAAMDRARGQISDAIDAAAAAAGSPGAAQ